MQAKTSLPCWRSEEGKEALQLAIWDLSLGIFGCALLQRWQRNSIDNSFSSSFNVAFPIFSISSITSAESRKNTVLNEFQCFLFLKCKELKSWLITWRCSCRIDGTWNITGNNLVSCKSNSLNLNWMFSSILNDIQV